MLRYVEEELAKRRAGDAAIRDDAARRDDARRPRRRFPRTSRPTSRRRDEKTTRAPRHMTGIVEVQLPMDYKMRNIEETERAKRAILERAREGRRGDAAARARPRREGDRRRRGRPPSTRPEDVRVVVRRVAVRGETRRHARGGGRDDERRETTNGGAGGGGGGRGAAAEVASDDLVFKRWMNNEKKRVRR